MSLSKEQIATHVEELRLEGQACMGYTDGVLAALVFVILGVPGIKIADLAGFEGPDLWKLAVIAHHKRPHSIETLPAAVRLSRGELFAVTYGLQKRLPELPIGRDIFEITDRTHPEHGGLMSKVLQTIAYAKRTHHHDSERA